MKPGDWMNADYLPIMPNWRKLRLLGTQGDEKSELEDAIRECLAAKTAAILDVWVRGKRTCIP
jgi:uncharacterized membrane protein YjdF